jgi:hypothetical protein
LVPVGIPRQHALLMFACSDLLAEWVLGNENACDTCQLLEPFLLNASGVAERLNISDFSTLRQVPHRIFNARSRQRPLQHALLDNRNGAVSNLLDL